MFQQKVKDQFLNLLSQIEVGKLEVVFPNQQSYTFEGKLTKALKQSEQHQAKLFIRDERALGYFAAKGDIGIAESYKNGWIESDDLVALLSIGLENADILNRYLYGGLIAKLISQLLYWFRLNTIKGSKKNIHCHYDLGNDFYSLWLDETMTYSAGIYKDEQTNLKEAQINKYDRIIDLLDSPKSLLEIGCGWGGFSERASEKTQSEIDALTISDNQYQFATKRLKNKAKIIKQDYRSTEGKYDSIVSIEMFEAVGEKFWPVYFHKLKSLLNSKGKAVIQTIHIKDELFEQYRKTGDMIRTYIFPGGMLPSVNRFKQEAKKANLKVVDEFSFGKDYAKTLSQWLIAFQNQEQAVKKLNFDDSFIRIWHFYLAYCIVGFRKNRTNVSQFTIEHAR